MKYFSTRDENATTTASAAILQGISKDGGLFVPQSFPKADLNSLLNLSYPELASEILGMYLEDYSKDFLLKTAKAVYSDENFEGKTANLVKVNDGEYSMELWHGPTCAFKDYALQIMPKLLVEAKKINNDKSKTLILVATSGDTGKAALDGYKNIDGVEIAVFFPNDGTSEIQRLQMATQEGNNVAVYAANGNFDNVQTGLKKVFTNKELEEKMAKRNIHFSSANSINWGRLAPQIVYYFASYFNLVKDKAIKMGDKVNYCVPTGNFGDILAGFYAKQMGLPIGKLICASNKNNVLTDFLSTGTYTAKRDFYKT
ncbi:MAG: threonine synthase, partial [Oscillospiraceae bacterium]